MLERKKRQSLLEELIVQREIELRNGPTPLMTFDDEALSVCLWGIPFPDGVEVGMTILRHLPEGFTEKGRRTSQNFSVNDADKLIELISLAKAANTRPSEE